MKTKYLYTLFAVSLLFLSSCIIKTKTIKYGQVGVKQKFGKIKETPLQPGLKIYGFGTKILRVHTKAERLSVNQEARTQDGTSITLYTDIYLSIDPEKVTQLIREYNKSTNINIYPSSFNEFMIPVIKESIAKVVSSSLSFDEINSSRENCANRIMAEIKNSNIMQYFTLDEVQLTTIKMDFVTASHVTKGAALKQELENMDLELELAKKKVELEKINATAEKGANEIIQPTLTEEVLLKEKIEIQKEAAKSGSTIIITD